VGAGLSLPRWVQAQPAEVGAGLSLPRLGAGLSPA